MAGVYGTPIVVRWVEGQLDFHSAGCQCLVVRSTCLLLHHAACCGAVGNAEHNVCT